MKLTNKVQQQERLFKLNSEITAQYKLIEFFELDNPKTSIDNWHAI